MLRFIEIDQDHWRYGLSVDAAQQAFVANETAILARAFSHRHWRPVCCALYAERGEEEEAAFRQRMLDRFGMEFPREERGVPVGLILYYDLPEENAYYLAQLLIDSRYQRRGYGAEAVRMAVDAMKKDGKYPKALTCVVTQNAVSRHLFESMGWTLTDDSDPAQDEELVYELSL
ncbi:MAG: GNAT family N-acetyltransferase [Clostridia bacterium]|nr:GNAT family N-acetyltransferase [Clostridia bacterium]